MNPVSPSHPGLVGATVSISSGLVSFFSQSLIVVQWCAAAVAVLAGLASVMSVIRHWDKNK